VRIVAVKQPLSTEQAGGLSDLLIACINEGAVVGYPSGTRPESAAAYWGSTIEAACQGRVALLVALDEDQAVLGTVQVAVHFPPDQAHVAGIQMLLVHPRCRRRAIGRHLMQAAEGLCRRMGRQVVILQTAGGPAGLLYAALGFAVCGIIPDLFRRPDGALTDGYLFHKRI
jgi:ribosomal protein S18 acetylase RimI-like enzyme